MVSHEEEQHRPNAFPPKSDLSAIRAPVDDFPDPEEIDLDELDDMLDEFSPAKPSVKRSPGKPLGPDKPDTNTTGHPDLEGTANDDFAKQLQAGMADFIKELETSPDMQTRFESMLSEIDGATAVGEAVEPEAGMKETSAEAGPTKASTDRGTAPASDKGTAAGDESFQETIKKTIERMQASGEQATAAASSENPDNFLADMMKAMQAGGAAGDGSEEGLSKMIMGMMEQLTNKDILYEPMKELNDKFPAWMENNRAPAKGDDLKRYRAQQVYVKEIVDRFELENYKDENAADRKYIVDRMQKMQAAGSPPADLVGDMAAAQEAFNAPEDGCPTQ